MYSCCIIQKASSKSLGTSTLIYNMKNYAGHLAMGAPFPMGNLYGWHSHSKHGVRMREVWKGLLR